MGQALGVQGCGSKGAVLLVAAANGDLVTAQELLAKYPKAASYYNFKDRSSPLLQAAARGHFELVQLVLETAVMTEGPERAKKNCIDHANSKRQTALMVACKHGHPDCVEYLVTNGGDPLLTDERRHNTCLHFAALYGHSECVHKLLGSRAAYRVQGRQVPVAQIPCSDEGVANVKFIDRHNGWGLSSLHIAVFQGSVSTVRALLRHGADIESVICASKVENSPIRCAVGSNALHIAALTGNIIMAKLILETQESYPGMELRSRTNAAGLKPHDYAQSARNPVLMHLLDERLPVALLRQIWMNYSLEQSLPPRHQTLGSMLQKLKLMFNLELIAIQRNLTHLSAQMEQQAAAQQLQLQIQIQAQQQAPATPASASAPATAPCPTPGAGAAASPAEARQSAAGTSTSPAGSPAQATNGSGPEAASASAGKAPAAPTPSTPAPAAAGAPATPAPAPAAATATATAVQPAGKHRCVEPAGVRLLWVRRQEEINQLLGTVTQLHDSLKQLCRRDEAPGEANEANGGLSRADRAATYEAVLDFILSTLITPRTVSAILHAAKKLVSASVTGSAAANAAGTGTPELPPGDSDSQHGLALLSTALRAVETCLQAAVYLTSPAALEQQASGAIAAGRLGLLPPAHTILPVPAGVTLTLPATGATTSVTADPTAGPPMPVLAGAASALAPADGGVDLLAPASASGFPAAAAAGAGAGAPAPGAGGASSPGADSAALVSDHPMTPPLVAVGTLGAPGPSPRPGVASLAPSLLAGGPLTLGAPGLVFPSASRGLADGAPAPSAFASHWSAHLHTLIAQLQWDIGVQRHRRRRAHAAAAAARSAAAAAAVVAATNPTTAAPAAGTAAAAGTAPAAIPATVTLVEAAAPPAGQPGGPRLTSSGAGDAGSGSDPAAADLVRALSSRRGDAVQDVVTSQTGVAVPALSTLQSGSDSGVSTPVAGAAAAAAAAAGAGAEAAGELGAAAAAAAASSPAAPADGAAPIGTEEIIPLVSGLGPPSRSITLASPAAAPAAVPAEASLAAAAAAATPSAKRPATTPGTKDRGKDREGGAGGDGGLDGQDDSPAASESGSDWSDDDRNVCSICMDMPVAVLVAGCQHGLCVQCAFQLCVKGRELPSCPFCRQKIGGFEAKELVVAPAAGAGATKPSTSMGASPAAVAPAGGAATGAAV
ncbi:hypothetical protein HYH03_001530 [Edaphochlamys debaryana]|uniref:RING-type domain-containing protein n=1 Tax=Edaphochlamys debaryana TaxID=47281 RepID=A0A835YGG5_9CHLO|nr:hypothetical protein HYH03_001530 [Edaphochlamys debaryana]|eukprot:KAG2500768.1 hypothetical protein HYH03_001530 [Edaphochlamys debaryana]